MFVYSRLAGTEAGSQHIQLCLMPESLNHSMIIEVNVFHQFQSCPFEAQDKNDKAR